MARKRQIGTRIDDSGEIAEAWDEYRRDFENKSSAMRQLMRRGLEVEQSEHSETPSTAEPAGRSETVESLSVGVAVTFIAWLIVTAANVAGLLTVTTGTLVVSGIVVVGFATTVLHLRTGGEEGE